MRKKKYIYSFQELKENLTYLDSIELSLINAAFDIAKEAHDGQFRIGGEPYVNHPLNVAYILSAIESDYISIITALLHDVVEDTKLTSDFIEEKFGKVVRNIIDGLTKINKINFNSKNEQLANYQRNLLVSLVEDPRIIIVKLADRLHNMRTLDVCSTSKQKRIASETLDLYTPLAHRLGIHSIKSELEDLSLRYLNTDEFYKIAEKLSEKKQERESTVNKMVKEVDEILNENNIKHEIKGRAKSIYSIYKKLNKGKKFEEIYDLQALRIIVNSVSECYITLGLIHSKYKLISKRFKDYIAQPKTNRYQSLHTTIFGADGKLFEIQIRTKEMNSIAEDGVASHWSYKEGKKSKIADNSEDKLQIFKSIMELNETVLDNEEFLNNMKEDILTKTAIYVYTPKGDIYELPKGSTPIDFAYRIHTDIGNKMIGAIVNDSIVPFNYVLSTGDIIKININPNSSGPKLEWLNIAKSTQTKNKIKNFYSKINREDLVEDKKIELEKDLKSKNIDIKDFYNNIDKLIKDLKLLTLEELYLSISNKYTTTYIINKYNDIIFPKDPLITLKNNKKEVITNSKAVIVAGIDNIKINFAECCHPIPGDNIVGHIVSGVGITVHRRSCHNSISNEEKMIEVNWNHASDFKYVTDILLEIELNNKNLVNAVNIINHSNINISKMILIKENTPVIYEMTLLVKNKDQLIKLISQLSKLKYVKKIERIAR